MLTSYFHLLCSKVFFFSICSPVLGSSHYSCHCFKGYNPCFLYHSSDSPSIYLLARLSFSVQALLSLCSFDSCISNLLCDVSQISCDAFLFSFLIHCLIPTTDACSANERDSSIFGHLPIILVHIKPPRLVISTRGGVLSDQSILIIFT